MFLGEGASDDALLESLEFARGGGNLRPAFSPDHHTYTLELVNNIDTAIITPTAADEDIYSITINGELVESGEASSAIPLAPSRGAQKQKQTFSLSIYVASKNK